MLSKSRLVYKKLGRNNWPTLFYLFSCHQGERKKLRTQQKEEILHNLFFSIFFVSWTIIEHRNKMATAMKQSRLVKGAEN